MFQRTSFLFLSLLLSAAVGCSGTSEKDDDDESAAGAGNEPEVPEVPDYCQQAFGPTDPTALIDDLEDRNPLIAPVAGRNGSWWVVSDGSAGSITPPSDAAPPPELIVGGRCEDSRYAVRITGQGFTEWGAVLVAGMRFGTAPEPVDLSDFRGIMFWAKVGETHNSAVRVQFQDSSTQPEGGVCDPTPGSTDECYNGWGTALLPLGTEWRLYQLEFSRMAQREFGHLGEAIDTTNIYSIEWSVTQNTVFDLWVDDVWLYE